MVFGLTGIYCAQFILHSFTPKYIAYIYCNKNDLEIVSSCFKTYHMIKKNKEIPTIAAQYNIQFSDLNLKRFNLYDTGERTFLLMLFSVYLR